MTPSFLCETHFFVSKTCHVNVSDGPFIVWSRASLDFTILLLLVDRSRQDMPVMPKKKRHGGNFRDIFDLRAPQVK